MLLRIRLDEHVLPEQLHLVGTCTTDLAPPSHLLQVVQQIAAPVRAHLDTDHPQPGEALEESVQEQLFGRYRPYGMPVSGYVDDVKKLGVQDLGSFYQKWYAPNNAMLIVAGDAAPDQVRQLA